MILRDLANNDILWVSVLSSILAQFLKPFTHQMRTGEWDWRQIAATGGMPSSHSALVCAAATGIGITLGFDSPVFAGAVVLCMVVTYDAAGVRREAGAHARAINLLIAEVLAGTPLEPMKYKEVLGHSRREVAAGIFFGVGLMLAWKFLLQPLFLPLELSSNIYM